MEFFITGWKNAIASLLLVVGVYFTNQIYALLNHGPAVINLHTALDSAYRWCRSLSSRMSLYSPISMPR